MSVPAQFSRVWPIQRTGSADNERIQINNALKTILNELQVLQGLVESRALREDVQRSISQLEILEEIAPFNLVVSNTPQPGDVLTYQDEGTFEWVSIASE